MKKFILALAEKIEKNNKNKLDNIKPTENDFSKNEENNNKKNDSKNSIMNNDDKIINPEKEKNEIINEFIDKIENKNKAKIENKKLNDNRQEEKESDDPFLNAEKEYRMKNLKKDNNIDQVKNQNNKTYSSIKIKSKKGNELIQKIIYNHFKKGYTKKNIDKRQRFQPNIYKNPERLYLKEIFESELNNIKIKSYNRRTGIFDIKKFNKNKLDYFNNNKKYCNIFNSIKTSFNHNNSKLKTFSNINYFYSKNNNKKEKAINIFKNKDLEYLTTEGSNHFFYTSLKTNSSRPIKSLTSKLKEKKGKENKNNYNKQTMINSANYKMPKKMQMYFNENNKKSKNNKLLHSRKITLKNKSANILNSIEDPKNPYSINFSRSLLKNHYNFDISYNKYNFEFGVPSLSLKRSNNRINLKDRKAKTSYDNFPSRFKKFKIDKNRKNNYRYEFKTLSGKL